MSTFLATLLVFGLAFAGLALGVLLGREPIRGSCGGLRKFGIEKDCSCEAPCPAAAGANWNGWPPRAEDPGS